MTFGWAMRGLPVERLAEAAGMTADELRALRDELVARVVAEARPPE